MCELLPNDYLGSMRRTRSIIGAILLAVGIGLAGEGAAQSIVSTGESFVRARLLLGPEEADGIRQAGLLLDMKPGWKTYWRQPGKAGIPPRFDWSGSKNVSDVRIDWPRPMRFESFGLSTLGYADRVILPMSVVPADPSRPVILDLGLELGVCQEICILEETRVERAFSPGDPATDARAISEAVARVPGPGREHGLTRATCRITGAGADREFEAQLVFDRRLDAPTVVLEGPDDTWFRGTEIVSNGGRIDVYATLSLLDESDWIERGDVRITVLAEEVAADIRGCNAASG